VEIAVLLLVAGFLFLALRGEHPQTTVIAEHMIANATLETGALNLVTAIYLDYRLFDTLGETIVLLLAVSGVMVLLEARK
jgi:multicomponent Na+:H+ antiporter subunit B